jgi:N-acetylglucosamine kinase-like BadF-type ATPase
VAAIYLGLDGGGTKTIARVVTTGESGCMCILGTGIAAGCNPYSVGWDASRAHVLEAIHGAIGAAEIGPLPNIAVLAIAGCASEAARQQIADWAYNEGFAHRVEVKPDTAPLLAEAPLDEPAVGLIAGTGSSAIAKRTDGASSLVGGWGYLIDDGGSGFHLGKLALQCVTQATDDPSVPQCEKLTASLLEHFGVKRQAEIKRVLYQNEDPRGLVASLAPLVLALAEDGKTNAQEIVHQGAAALACLVDLAVRKAQAGISQRVNLYASGSLLVRSVYYRGEVETLLRSSEQTSKQLALGGRLLLAPDAACGCCRLAAELGEGIEHSS